MSKLERMVQVPNPQYEHCATVLLLDTSGSMNEQGKIDRLNEGLKSFTDGMMEDEIARKSIDLAVITFGGKVETVRDFASMESFTPPVLNASGETPMGEAILRAIESVEARKQQYKAESIDQAFRPWIFMITDGEPTDIHPGDAKWAEVVAKVHEGEKARKFLFFCVAVQPANVDKLREVAPPNRAPQLLDGLRFQELFGWLRDSLTKVSQPKAPKAGDQVELPPLTGWTRV